jgi:hypothetical protein
MRATDDGKAGLPAATHAAQVGGEVYPPSLLPNGMSSGNMFLVNDVEILNDNMFCDLGCQVNKVHIIFKAVECFDSMVVLKIAVDGSL